MLLETQEEERKQELREALLKETQEEERKQELRRQIKSGDVDLIIDDFKEKDDKDIKFKPLRYVIKDTRKYTINENSNNLYCVDDKFIYNVDIAKVRNKIRRDLKQKTKDDGISEIEDLLNDKRFAKCIEKIERLKDSADYDLKFIKHCEIDGDSFLLLAYLKLAFDCG